MIFNFFWFFCFNFFLLIFYSFEDFFGGAVETLDLFNFFLDCPLARTAARVVRKIFIPDNPGSAEPLPVPPATMYGYSRT